LDDEGICERSGQATASKRLPPASRDGRWPASNAEPARSPESVRVNSRWARVVRVDSTILAAAARDGAAADCLACQLRDGLGHRRPATAAAANSGAELRQRRRRVSTRRKSRQPYARPRRCRPLFAPDGRGSPHRFRRAAGRKYHACLGTHDLRAASMGGSRRRGPGSAPRRRRRRRSKYDTCEGRNVALVGSRTRASAKKTLARLGVEQSLIC